MSVAVKRIAADGKREVIYRANTPDFPTADWVCPADISAITEEDPFYWFIDTDDSIRDMTTEEKNTADLDRLEILKAARRLHAHTVTQVCYESCSATFNGAEFSITAEAQRNWLAMTTAAQFDMMYYPCEVTKNDGTGYSFQTKVEFLAFGQVVLGTVKAIVDIERSLITSIQGASTKPELDAIVDPRI